jgi:hypothetical protein
MTSNGDSALTEKSWEELAIRWGRQLAEVVRSVNNVFNVSIDRCPAIDSPADIILTLALKERKDEKTGS